MKLDETSRKFSMKKGMRIVHKVTAKNRRGKDRLKDTGVQVRILLKWIIEEFNVKA
jgi:hypothetical protein